MGVAIAFLLQVLSARPHAASLATSIELLVANDQSSLHTTKTYHCFTTSVSALTSSRYLDDQRFSEQNLYNVLVETIRNLRTFFEFLVYRALVVMLLAGDKKSLYYCTLVHAREISKPLRVE